MNVVFKVIETNMYPCKWFGGPTFNGRILKNSTCYYFEKEEDAQKFVQKMNKPDSNS